VQFPIAFHIGHTIVPLHGVLESLGIFIAFRFMWFLRKKQGDTLEQHTRYFVIAAAALGALAGSHLLGALENIPAWRASPSYWAFLVGNKTLVGGLLGGLASVELTKKALGERTKTGDLFTFPLLLGMILGRIGCFTTGVYEQTYGLPTTLPWALNLGDGILRHPVTLYEIAFLLSLWIILYRISITYVLEQGALFKMFMISYLLFRFLLDFIKPGWRYLFGLGSIQLACLAGLIYYVPFILKPRLLLSTS
jgi:phosphatidylglycerol:prolipoprotein diacylglycerol transferase